MEPVVVEIEAEFVLRPGAVLCDLGGEEVVEGVELGSGME